MVWKYEQGDFDSLKHVIASTNWYSLADADIDTYTKNITQHIISISKKHTHYKISTISNTNPPRMLNEIRKFIRKGTFQCHTKIFVNSFLPSTITKWIQLPYDLRNSPTLAPIKIRLSEGGHKIPSHYYVGDTKFFTF